MIPNIDTDRNWVTVNIENFGADHSIIFIHNNLHPENYNWLKTYKDLILVCGIPETCEKVAHLGKPIYLPLSIDVEEVIKHKTEKTKEAAFVGRSSKRNNVIFPEKVDYIENVPRTVLLKTMAMYKRIYAVGRTAIEAKCLGCDILPYDPRYPDPSIWKVLDVHDAVDILQRKLDEIDK